MVVTKLGIVAIFSVGLAAACDSSNSSTLDGASVDASDVDAAADLFPLPGLGAGSHLGLWTSYELLPIGLAASADARLAEARTAGLDVGRVHIAWNELEPSPGQFDLEILRESLEALTADGLAAHVLIETVDSDGFSLPADLVDASAPYKLAAGRRFDDPVITGRFAALVAQAATILSAHRVFAVSIGNEPDAYFDDVAPATAEGVAWRDSLVGFLTAGRTALREAIPGVPVGLTLREGSIGKGWSASLAPIVEAGDFAAFNYYCQDDAFQVKAATTVPGELDAMAALAAGRPIVLQELGCPAGRTTGSTVGATDAAQAAFFQAVFEATRARPAFRTAFAFQLVDWSPALAATYGDAYRAAGFPLLADQIEETLGTIGLLRFSDGQPRSSWGVLLDALGTLQ